MSTRTFLACAFAAATLLEGRARATVSAINLTPTLVTRVASDGTTTYECPGRGQTVVGCIVDGSYQGIGYNDCVADSELVFPITVTGLPDATGNLQIWAGTGDCTQAGATNNNTTATCWMVAAPPTPQPVMDINVRVADIAAYLGKTNPNLPQTYMPASAATACTNASASTTTTVTDDAGDTSTTVGEATVNIYFMWFLTGTEGQAPAVASSPYAVKVKLVGPEACTGVTAGPGDTILLVDWLPPAGDTTIQGFNLYAVPSGVTTGEAGTVTVCNDAGIIGTPLFDDAGNEVFDDAGNPIYVDDAGNPVMEPDASCYQQIVPPNSNACTGSVDVAGIQCGLTPDGSTSNTDAAAAGGLCVQVNGPTNASGTITGLTNGVAYDVAVAAFDQYGNIGQVAGGICSTPAPINDFWKVYNQDGGNAFCALDVIGKGGGSMAAALMAIAGIVYTKRRRRQPR